MSPRITVAIPTYGRERVLVETLRLVLALEPRPAEVLVVDQTPRHEEATEAALGAWADRAAIRWLRLAPPSITLAMNTALIEAASPVVLFLDDDVIPAPGLIAAHAAAYADPTVWAVVGQVLQPGEEPEDLPPRGTREGLRADLEFPFRSTRTDWVRNVMAGNLSVRRDRAIEVGGFDENFVRVAYRFETEFARRVVRHGGRIRFEPAASIRHLRAGQGGTRSFTTLLRTHRPDHAVGDYYFALLNGPNRETAAYVARRLVRSLTTRYLATHPWWVPAKLLGELRGLLWAMWLAAQGQALLQEASVASEVPSCDANGTVADCPHPPAPRPWTPDF